MDYRITWLNVILIEMMQWTWPGSIPHRSRSHETFKGLDYTCLCPG